MNWRFGRLGDVMTLQRGHDLPAARRQDGDVPIISSSGITGHHSEAKAKAPGVVTGRYGTIGEVFYVEVDYWPLNTALYVTDFKGNRPPFVAYLLRTVLANYQSDKAAVPGVNRNVLHELKVRYPDGASQDRIVTVLSAYDALIENNQRRMVLLEETARQLHREWFVRLRFPGYEHARMINGVPEGWRRVRTPDVIEINPTTQLSREIEHWSVEMADLPVDGMVIQQASKREGRSGSKFRNGDTLFARITPCLENGKTAFVAFMEDGEVGRGSTEFIVLRSKCVTPEFVYCLARTYDFRENAIKSMVGSSGRQRVQESCFEKFVLLLPTQTLLSLFADTVRPMFQAIKNLHTQNQKLGAARDLLLPRLMSGEIGGLITDINSEDRLVQKTFADHLENALGWDSVYAYNAESFGPSGTLGRASERNVVLVRDLRVALAGLNPDIPPEAREQAIEKLTRIDFARSLVPHNREFYGFIRNGVPVEWRDTKGDIHHAHARVIDFRDTTRNRFLAVRELKIQGVRVPHYNRRADLICFVNGLPLVLIELKAVYRNIRAGFDDNLTDYMSETSIAHAFHHNAFLVVSNGDAARYGSITSKWDHFLEWKRNAEKDKARVDAEALLDGMLMKDRLLDLVENFVLFDASRAGGVRKIVARNHQVLGVNAAVASVLKQEDLKKQFPQRTRAYTIPIEPVLLGDAPSPNKSQAGALTTGHMASELAVFEPTHPDLGRLGVFWHTQGSGKSYSMAFFAEKVRRVVPGNFTFLVMTDREDLDDQISRTFAGCGVSDEKTPRASSGKELKELLTGNHRFIFSLIHKFNQPVTEPYSERDDIIVISDEAHRSQSGKFARNMRLALPNASFIGFTGTPLFKHDELTRRIFGNYVSRYDFKRSVEDQSTVKLVYDNRGEKLGIAHLDLNDRIADAIEKADLDPDQTALLEKLLGKDYEVITADDRLDKLADDFVEHASTRWESGKSMFVCIDKITCARVFQRIEPRWKAKLRQVEALASAKEALLTAEIDTDDQERLGRELEELRGRAQWMTSTLIEIIISEAQNEVRDFQKWGFDIIPHRMVMKTGFETPDGKRVKVDEAFKNPEHPFRIAIVCAMWLTGFDVECLATLYIDKPMKAHNLMQAISRANRVYPGKDCGVIVDYNGMLRSLRAALAQYALGDEDEGDPGDVVGPIEDLVNSLVQAIEFTEGHLLGLGFDARRLQGAFGFTRLEALRDAVDATYTSDEAKRRFEIMARQVFTRFKALLMKPVALAFAERHDNIEAIYKKLQDRRETADVTEVLKELHRIVNEAIRAAGPGTDNADGFLVDLSLIDFAKLRDEFASKVQRKHVVLQDIRAVVERKLAQMMARNPMRMDFYKKYMDIIADYNREKDRATVEATFAELVKLAAGLDMEQRRAAEEGLNDDELALFDLLSKDKIGKADRERLKQASRALLASLREVLKTMQNWTQNAATQAEVKVSILDNLYQLLPRPPYTDQDTDEVAERIYEYVRERSVSGNDLRAA